MMDLQHTKNIIFDLGGVIINLNPNAVINTFKNLVKDTYPAMEQDLYENKVLEKYEKGQYTSSDFISFFRSYDSRLLEQDIVEAWNSMLLDIPEERIFLIRNLSRKYRIFLLSNTNEIHMNHINSYMADEYGFKDMSYLFEKAYYSHLMGLRKPQPSIFETILNENKLVAEETLFIDDSEEHIIAAKQLNLKTYHLKHPETITDIFHEH